MSIFSALLTRVSNNGKTFQAKFLGKTKSGIRSLTPYGFFSVPPVESKLVIFKDAFESNYAVGYKDDIIPILKEGEAVFGNFVKGTIIFCDENGNINITCNGNKTVTVTGNCTINVTGDANINAKDVNVIATGTATIDGTNIKLGASALVGVARVGDPVSVDSGTHIGTITAGSSKVTSE